MICVKREPEHLVRQLRGESCGTIKNNHPNRDGFASASVEQARRNARHARDQKREPPHEHARGDKMTQSPLQRN